MSQATLALVLLAAAQTVSSAGPQPPTFPQPLSAYAGDENLELGKQLASRIRAEPLNAVATAIFLLAILRTFAAPAILAYADRLEGQARAAAAADVPGDDIQPPDPYSFKLEVLHLLGEVEAVFGIWVVPLLAAITIAKGWGTAEAFLSHGVAFTEPLFVVVIMALSATRPVMAFAESAIGIFAALGGRTPLAWWLSILTVGPILGSLVTEPAAMTISAMLLARLFYRLKPPRALKYATIGLLFVNVSVGGTLTHFAAPPVLMVAGKWGWGTGFMLGHFGWKAVAGILLSNLTYRAVFFKPLRAMRGETSAERAPQRTPAWVIATNLAFVAFTVLAAHTPALFIGGFLFFLAFAQATAPHQRPIDLRPALLVGFFLGGLVIHGTLQQWWIGPVLRRLDAWPLMVGATVLTAFNDNAAITYLASLVPDFSNELKHAVMAGAVAGGGMTVIANAPNPAGRAILSEFFDEGITPLELALGALVPTLIVGACLMLLPSF